MTALFLGVLAVVIVGTAFAVAGRWRPQGLPDLPPAPPGAHDGRPARFDVVLRGYRMDQVDAEIARLRSLAGEQDGDSTPEPAGEATNDESAAPPAGH